MLDALQTRMGQKKKSIDYAINYLNRTGIDGEYIGLTTIDNYD